MVTMTRRSFVAASGGLLALLAAGVDGGAAPETAGNPAQQALAAQKRGLDWLKAHQKASGAWSDENYPALTALGLWAFARSTHPDRATVCAQAAAFVSGFAQSDGGIYKVATGGRGSGGLSTYNTAICMTALHSLDPAKYAPLIAKARAFMAGSQVQGDSPDAGGFGYERVANGPRGRPDLSNTGWSLMAMRATQGVTDGPAAGAQPADIDWGAALNFVTRLQNQDANDPENRGGFGYELGGERGGTTVKRDGAVALRGFGSMTYAGLESMLYAQPDRQDPRVRSALGWAARHWSVTENPGMGSKGLFYYYTIMAKALSLAGTDTLAAPAGKAIPWRQELLTQLVRVQHADGSWANTDNTFWENDPALTTSYAVLTLQLALPAGQ